MAYDSDMFTVNRILHAACLCLSYCMMYYRLFACPCLLPLFMSCNLCLFLGVATCLTAHACGHWRAPRVLCLSSRTELIHCELFVVELPLRVALLVRTATTTTTGLPCVRYVSIKGMYGFRPVGITRHCSPQVIC